MFETLNYLVELTVSVYFFCIYVLFVVNVCEFMPSVAHYKDEEDDDDEPYPLQTIITKTFPKRTPGVVINESSKRSVKNRTSANEKMTPSRNNATMSSGNSKADETDDEEVTSKRPDEQEFQEEPETEKGKFKGKGKITKSKPGSKVAIQEDMEETTDDEELLKISDEKKDKSISSFKSVGSKSSSKRESKGSAKSGSTPKIVQEEVELEEWAPIQEEHLASTPKEYGGEAPEEEEPFSEQPRDPPE